MGQMKLNADKQAFDRAMAFNQRHKARRDDEQASSHGGMKDVLVTSMLEAQEGLMTRLESSIKTTCEKTLKDESEKRAADLAAKLLARQTTLEDKLRLRDETLQKNIAERDAKLQGQIQSSDKNW